MRLKELSSADYARLSALLDAALDAAPASREAWLTDLSGTDPGLAALLRDLLAPLKAGDTDSASLRLQFALAHSLGSASPADPPLIGQSIGPYRVLSLIGHGGMGSVWLAERVDGLFERRVALKLVPPALMSSTGAERFARERDILARLDHPHIARLLDAGFTPDRQPYLALEYVAGVPLTTYCDEHALPVEARLQLFLQVVEAVQYAHAHLVLHRDLKPSNILVTAEGRVRLLDFGIAKLLTEGQAPVTQLTALGGRALTPDYAAPEQILGVTLTTAADVYALGVMLYELLCAQRPYRLKRSSAAALEEAILGVEPVPPSRVAGNDAAARARATTAAKLARTLRGDLDAIVSKALRKSPAERYPTAAAFGEDIERYLRGQVVLAQPDSLAYRAVKFMARRRLPIAVVGLLFLTLTMGLAASIYEARIARARGEAALEAQLRTLTQTAATRLRDGETPAAMAIILEVLDQPGARPSYTPEALSVFQEAQAADMQLAALVGHSDRLWGVAYSHDGRRIVTGSYDHTARVWDAATGRPELVLRGHTAPVVTAAFSPDDRRILTGSSDHSARIWDARTAESLMVLAGHGGTVAAAAFSNDGRRIVTASNDHTARVWDAATGRQLLRLPHDDRVYGVAFSPDSTRIVTGSQDAIAYVWEARSGRLLLKLPGHADAIMGVRFSADGRRIVTASRDRTARIWDAATGALLMILSGHASPVYAAGFSPDGLTVLTASTDNTARTWDAATGQPLHQLSGHGDSVLGAAYAPDGDHIATSSYDGTARTWDTQSARARLTLRGHTDFVETAVFSPDGQQILTASSDRTARIWNAATGSLIRTLTGHDDRVLSARYSPDGRLIVTASDDKTARIWSALTGAELRRLTGHTDRVWFAAFSPDGSRIVTTSTDHTARIWDAHTGQELRRLIGHQDWIANAAFSPDGGRVVTASDDHTARIWSVSTGEELRTLSGHAGTVESATFSPDGVQVVTASYDTTVRLWDAASGRELRRFIGHRAEVEHAAFSPDGRYIATASADGTARIWDRASGRQLAVLSGHAKNVETASFSPDGLRIVTASMDRTARVWDARVTPLEKQLSWARAAQFETLTSDERLALGLAESMPLRPWPHDATDCERDASAPYDPERHAPGQLLQQVNVARARDDCARTLPALDRSGRGAYLSARIEEAAGHPQIARRRLEQSLALGYAAAAIDLARLVAENATSRTDVEHALELERRAWNRGIQVAAFDLGQLYEHGVAAHDGRAALLASNPSLAAQWYGRGADAGEPNALAWWGRRAECYDCADSPEAVLSTQNQLAAFGYYAAAAERARLEEWPDAAWQPWRYRRASLARLLARAGHMEEVATAYDRIKRQYRSAAAGH
ncbi:MAG TPA: protein kinase [Steroidobacteraceae bacterium]|nr:protein kinase [Steroidobacteraceae bacterium]